MDDKDTTITELKKKTRKFTDDREWDQFHNAKDIAIAIVNEASEILEHFVYKSNEEVENMFKDSKKREEVEDEVADTIWAIMMLAERYDIDISTALDKKLKKTALKYPIEKAKGINKKYTEYN